MYLNHSQSTVLSGMRPTGALHLGHLYGVLRQWVTLQKHNQCFWFVADWHALTTGYQDIKSIRQNGFDMVVDWLACGVNPDLSHMFIQSDVKQHSEFFLLLSMMTPRKWLERIPTYKDKAAHFQKNPEMDTYGFLGYPLLQAADILLYQATAVPVGEDQVSHVELVREIARRFNFLYGQSDDLNQSASTLLKRLGENGRQLKMLSKRYRQDGDEAALEDARALLNILKEQLNVGDWELLQGYIEGKSRIILKEPQPIVTKNSKLLGTDGQKMSKSYNNVISLRDDPSVVNAKIKLMPTDPARVRKTDPGNPLKCPVWNLHQSCTTAQVHQWVEKGCTSGRIGCLECKKTVCDAINEELQPIRERIQEISNQPTEVHEALESGKEIASKTAENTLEIVRDYMGLSKLISR